MGGRAQKIIFAALIGLLFAGPARAEATSAPPAARDGKGPVQLGEVRITGSPEHPGILFFLPRTRFHLLSPRRNPDWREELLREDREKGAIAP